MLVENSTRYSESNVILQHRPFSTTLHAVDVIVFAKLFLKPQVWVCIIFFTDGFGITHPTSIASIMVTLRRSQRSLNIGFPIRYSIVVLMFLLTIILIGVRVHVKMIRSILVSKSIEHQIQQPSPSINVKLPPENLAKQERQSRISSCGRCSSSCVCRHD